MMGWAREQIGKYTKSKRGSGWRRWLKRAYRKLIRRSEKADPENPWPERKYNGWSD